MTLTSRLIGRLAAVASLAALTGCGTLQTALQEPAQPDFTPVYPVARETPRMATGSIYQQGTGDTLLGRARRFQAGDVITVILRESAQAGNSVNSSLNRKGENDVIPSGLSAKLGSQSLKLKGLNLNSGEIKSEGKGAADQSATLDGEVTVTVVEVLSNGNLMVRGEKLMNFTQGSEVLQVSGVIRPDDVSPNNTVQSRRLANARFAYQASGDVATAGRAGWGTRALMKIWPF